MPLEQELLSAGFTRDFEITELNQANEYAVSLADDRPLVRLSPSDMLNGWWYSRFDSRRECFDFIRVPVGLSWITRELQKIGSQEIPFQWWSKIAAGFYKCHPWVREAYSRVYAGNLIPLSTVTLTHESYPETVGNYLSTEPFAIRGTDPRPTTSEATGGSNEKTGNANPLLEKLNEATFAYLKDRDNDVKRAAFATGRLNIQDDIERMAREAAARRADEMFTSAQQNNTDEDEGDPFPVYRRRRRAKRQKEEKPKLDPILATGRKFDL